MNPGIKAYIKSLKAHSPEIQSGTKFFGWSRKIGRKSYPHQLPAKVMGASAHQRGEPYAHPTD
jgi:hypothetical protein